MKRAKIAVYYSHKNWVSKNSRLGFRLRHFNVPLAEQEERRRLLNRNNPESWICATQCTKTDKNNDETKENFDKLQRYLRRFSFTYCTLKIRAWGRVTSGPGLTENLLVKDGRQEGLKEVYPSNSHPNNTAQMTDSILLTERKLGPTLLNASVPANVMYLLASQHAFILRRAPSNFSDSCPASGCSSPWKEWVCQEEVTSVESCHFL